MLLIVFDQYARSNPPSGLLVGTAKMNITPPVGIKMSGHAQRTLPSQAIHDSLYAKVLVLEADGQRTAFITCDLIGYNNKKVLDIARQKFNIPNVLISYSHTHSGPNLGDSDNYAKLVEKAMIDGLGKALKNQFSGKISAGFKTFPQLGYNRLTGRRKEPAMWRDYEKIPYGPVDPEVGVIKIEDEKGNPRVILMQYACHAVVNLQNLDISADYPGVATKKVEETFGKNTMCMFIQGGAGDINPLFMSWPGSVNDEPVLNTDYTQIEKMGNLLAQPVIETAKAISPKNIEKASIKIMSDSLKFKSRTAKGREFNIHITTILINNEIAIAASCGEFFVKHQIFWKQNAEVPYPFFFGYTYSSGGSPAGYVPDIRSAAYGGYGADSNIEVGAGEEIMLRHLQNLYRLRGILKN
jgi:hypothetical protein